MLTGDVSLLFDLAKQKFTYATGPNNLRLDILRDAAGNRVEFVKAMGRMYFNIHASAGQKEEFAPALDYLNNVLNIRQLPSQLVRRAPYRTALDVFERVNRAG